MNNAIKSNLIDIAKRKALLPFHGTINNIDSNLKPIIDLFPKWSVKDADNCWCSAFVYYCLVESGFEIPYSPKECVTCSLAGCGGFLEFAIKDNRIDYITDINLPNIGDIVIFDYLFCNKEHDHIGIIIDIQDNYIICSEGNIPGTNQSGIIKRTIDKHIRGYIRIPDGYKY